jgi:putative phosphoesterase
VPPEVVRIGVVADTHVGEYLDALPPALFDALAGCELILHAGDISRPWVLDELARIAPVVAVRGDHDRLDGLALPRSTVVTVAGRRIGLVHGRRAFPLDLAVIVANVLARRRLRWRAGLHRGLIRAAGPADCVVYGHWHEPDITRVGDTLVFSPGAVCPWGSLEGGRAPGRGWQGIADRWVRRYRAQLGTEAMRRNVGLLEVRPDGIAARVIPLD